MTQRNAYSLRLPLQVLCAFVFALAAICLSALALTPAYAAETIPIPLTVENTVTGSPANDETFAFVLEAETANAPMPSSDEVSITGSGSVSFSDIHFTQEGQYRYKLYEKAGNTAGYTYDTTVYQVLVNASWQGSTLVTQVVAWKGDAQSDETKVSKLAFENTYTKATRTVSDSSAGSADSTGGSSTDDGSASSIIGKLVQTGDASLLVPLFVLAFVALCAITLIRRRWSR